MRTSTLLFVGTWLGCLACGCSKGASAPGPATANSDQFVAANADAEMSGCNHDATSRAIIKHAWPYPADARNIEWMGQPYERIKLKLSPNPGTFYTATVSWRKGELVEVLDSWVYIKKPRRVIANEEIWVTRKVWDQGLKVDKQLKVASKGDEVDFLFYNSKRACMIETAEGPAWTHCTLGTTFEDVTVDAPFACEQVWWMEVEKSRPDKGWMPFEESLMRRVGPPGDEAKQTSPDSLSAP